MMIIGGVMIPFVGALWGFGAFAAICGAIFALLGWYAKAPVEKKPIQEEPIPEVIWKSQQAPSQAFAVSPQAAKRPRGVAILAILEALLGISLLLLGTLTFIVPQPSVYGLAIGGGMLLVGVFLMVVAWNLRKGRKWARDANLFLCGIYVILTVLGLFVEGLTPMNLIRLVWLSAICVVVYYLRRPNVRAYFGT